MFPTLASIVLIVCTSAFTVAASIIDYRTHRIPNKLTLPMFAVGWVYQLAFWQLNGLLDGLAGFAIGFGMFFLLWVIGSGGGGDAKLVGAVAVWLGFKMTIALIIVSTILVILGTGVLMLYGMLTRGVYRTKRDFIPNQPTGKKNSPLELLKFNRGRSGMTYGLSVAIATVLVVTLTPVIEAAKKQRDEEKARRQVQKVSPEQSTDASEVNQEGASQLKTAADSTQAADVPKEGTGEKPQSTSSP